MRRVIMYHDDADGRCSAAIAGRHGRCCDDVLVYVPMQYGDAVPWQMFDMFEKGKDEFIMVDFSLPEDLMERVQDLVGDSFIWIDHHKTAIKDLKRFQTLKGLRIRGNIAACLLTWNYFFSRKKEPMAVQYIADRDVWKFYYGDETRCFYELYKQENTHPWQGAWDRWFEDTTGEFLDLELGKKLYRARIEQLKGYALSLGREHKIFGTEYRALVVNFPGSGDMGQVIKDLGYDIAHCYVDQERDGRMMRTHAVYSDKVDVGEVAKLYGGGGHKGAAGWVEMV